MKGVYQVMATKGGKTITSEVFGSLAEKGTLFARLMNRHKIMHSERNLWKLSSVTLITPINK
jgi:hypothetical protein|tara:strand:+ start:4049 stop:4234 length:186 start_codon:yes stop_codon:yes gene_type:complete